MPNWVWNQMTIEGSNDRLDAFIKQARQPYKQDQWEGAPMRESDISLWNFLRPDDSILDEYYGEEPRDLSFEERIQYKTNHWYDWNIRNWGCKWDASDALIYKENEILAYEFNTPWSPPLGAFSAMVAQYPDLKFKLFYSEEQGWGGEVVGKDGVTTEIDEWDIPETHEERMNRFGYCHCEEMNDDEVEYMYDDCPKKLANV